MQLLYIIIIIQQMMHLTERYNNYFCCKGSFYYSKNKQTTELQLRAVQLWRTESAQSQTFWRNKHIGVSSDLEQFTKGRRFIFNSREYKVDSSSVLLINLTVDSVMRGGDLYYQLELEGKGTLLHDGSATD